MTKKNASLVAQLKPALALNWIVRTHLTEIRVPHFENFFQERNIQIKFKGDELSPNIMDRWILSFTQSLLIFVRKEMAAYRLYTVVPRLIKFIDNLTNWYVRMNRKRFKVSNTALSAARSMHEYGQSNLCDFNYREKTDRKIVLMLWQH